MTYYFHHFGRLRHSSKTSAFLIYLCTGPYVGNPVVESNSHQFVSPHVYIFVLYCTRIRACVDPRIIRFSVNFGTFSLSTRLEEDLKVDSMKLFVLLFPEADFQFRHLYSGALSADLPFNTCLSFLELPVSDPSWTRR